MITDYGLVKAVTSYWLNIGWTLVKGQFKVPVCFYMRVYKKKQKTKNKSFAMEKSITPTTSNFKFTCSTGIQLQKLTEKL